jgi:hypothetical protein
MTQITFSGEGRWGCGKIHLDIFKRLLLSLLCLTHNTTLVFAFGVFLTIFDFFADAIVGAPITVGARIADVFISTRNPRSGEIGAKKEGHHKQDAEEEALEHDRCPSFRLGAFFGRSENSVCDGCSWTQGARGRSIDSREKMRYASSFLG